MEKLAANSLIEFSPYCVSIVCLRFMSTVTALVSNMSLNQVPLRNPIIIYPMDTVHSSFHVSESSPLSSFHISPHLIHIKECNHIN